MVLHLATYIDRCNCKTPSEKVPPKVDLIDIGIHILISKVIHLFAVEKIKEWTKFLRQFCNDKSPSL